MAGEWRELIVENIAAHSRNALVGGPFGSNLISDDYVASGVPVIRGQNMGHRWLSGKFAFVSEEKAEALAPNIARPGDVIFTQRGTLGQVSLVPQEPFDRYLISQSQMKLTVRREIANPLFIYYQFSSSEQQEYIRQNAIQTGVPHTNLGILRKTPIVLPPLAEQEAVAHILGSLDDKIELNRRMNETLEAMARALFKSWFVDFDPVRAKAEGRDLSLPQDTTELFAASLAQTEIGEIPSDWRVEPISNLAEIAGGSTPHTEDAAFWNNGTHWWATPKDLSKLQTPVLLGTEKRITDAGLLTISSGLLPSGTVLLSSRAPIGYLAIAEVPVAINQGFIAMKPRDGVSNIFLFLWAKSAHEEILSRANGSTFLEISKANFRPIPVARPPVAIMQAFHANARPLYDRIVMAAKEEQMLVHIRDALLPKLISGQIRIKDAEKLAANAA